jgi:dTDP-4-dehydrorhamnose 3,5-epimerase
MKFMRGIEFVQCNESFSRKGTVRGLHFQWNPYMGKFVRTINGRMVDLILDIRKGSPNFGKLIAYDMPAKFDNDYNEWIWIPPGFAHGNFFTEDTVIEYFCSGEYNQNCEAGISPLSKDIDWSLCDQNLKKEFDDIVSVTKYITEKDRNGFSIRDWEKDNRSNNFIYGKL